MESEREESRCILYRKKTKLRVGLLAGGWEDEERSGLRVARRSQWHYTDEARSGGD